ncbi:hypothetical protein RN001_003156 [Aquatica leii]|uniref:Uncharacterized protein n=1 Tax=Aquatica leii TaxID=1421715 RepID=A0AAN7PEJ5_9COLE|nr:hypothetical protein RN001_003156 [Aquatica leii]
MSAKVLSRTRKQKQKDEMKQDIVAQVHKSVKRDQSEERENNIEETESKKNFILEDKNDNYSLRTPSRDVSVDGEAQINTKIINLIETEMKRDITKVSHFTDSRPQSLSFYEEEKIPEELSGNLELLSPEERKHYKRRKEYNDIDLERNAYNNLQDSLCRENDDGNKKSKRKKKHSGETEVGLGDSREMMIPKEKRKSKKKKREYSPLSSASGKRKHKKRDDDYEPKNEITLALEELQDDVFENGPDDFARPERMKKSPKKSDKLYIQRKNRFEVTSKNDQSSFRLNMPAEEYCDRSILECHPIHLAVATQKSWLPLTLLCHGLLGGMALGHYLYFYSIEWQLHEEQLDHYAQFCNLYTSLFFGFCIISMVSVFDRYDISHISIMRLPTMFKTRKSLILVIIYTVCFLIHLSTADLDDKISLISNRYNVTYINITDSEWKQWSNLSYWRNVFAIFAWIILALFRSEDLFYNHLKTMEKYAVLD